MNGNGWVKLYRKLMESAVWQDEGLCHLWVCCLLLANHAEKWVKVPGLAAPVKVLPGQFITGRFELHKHLYPHRTKKVVCPKTVWRRLETLQAMSNLSLNVSNKFTLVTICNWGDYQFDEPENVQVNVQQVSSTCPARVQQVSTNKNDKKKKNEKKVKKTEPDFTIPDDLQTPEFKLTWGQYVQHRREIKKPMTDLAAEMALKKCSEWGTQKATVAIENSIANGWTGLFEPKGNGFETVPPAPAEDLVARLHRIQAQQEANGE